MKCVRFQQKGAPTMGLWRASCWWESHPRELSQQGYDDFLNWHDRLLQKPPASIFEAPEGQRLCAFTPRGLARFEWFIKAKLASKNVPMEAVDVDTTNPSVHVVYQDDYQIVFESSPTKQEDSCQNV